MERMCAYIFHTVKVSYFRSSFLQLNNQQMRWFVNAQWSEQMDTDK